MLSKSLGSLCVILLTIPFLSGCWDSLDIEKRATVLGLAIDKIDSDSLNEDHITHFPNTLPNSDQEMIRLTAQISVPGRIPLGPQSGGGGGEQEPVWVVTANGHTLEDALLNLQQELADELFLGHLRIIVISEELAKEGIERFNDYLRRQPEVRRTAWMAVSQEEAAKYMEVAPKLERVPTLYLTYMVKNAVDLGKFPKGDIGIFWRSLSSKGQDAYLPYLKIKGSQNIEMKGLSFFKDDKMKGIIDPIEIGSYMSVLGYSEGGYGAFIKVPGTEESVLVRAVRRKSRMKSTIKNGKPVIRIKIQYESEIVENENDTIKLDNSKLLRQIEKKATKDVTNSLNNLIRKMQEEESDIFGFGEQIRAKHPTYWRKKIKSKENWRKVYKDLEVHVDMNTHIRQVGMKAK
ncbi:Ger(x)C family spore germination protein [Lederbergia lenta]|uniref:Ger(X)C family germination protein n=1 Tax=Lederbergia lenta TaxID=1467 RepID=A0A2X4WPC6_LEDLE|nr:Ger(x)C family spore germination protein [Lederbergia lenta]MCM3109715.1 Ger(x)C family spore germination protein [Lederbergia lenta]MEC2324534.1 Ger(x)C family spore germination protein [Lederbergia lenta]SQI59510.1 Ger(x)C family germination protein [Lederbergia lenta]